MSVNLAYIESIGGDQASLKTIFEKKEADQSKEVVNLLARMRGRMYRGATKIMSRSRYWKAIDGAYDVSLNSVSVSMVKDMLASEMSQEQILNQLKTFGISPDLFMRETVVNGQIATNATGNTVKTLHLPSFWAAFINTVSYYTSIRKGKIVTDVVGQEPLHKYEPARMTTKDRLRCDLLTQVIARQNTALGNRASESDAIEPALKYGSQVSFPMESWWREEQVKVGADGKVVMKTVDGKQVPEKVVIREGVRWFNPHITRWYVDEEYPLFMLNTDTGPNYGGHYAIWRYSEIADNPNLFNKDQISVRADHWYRSNQWDVYSTVYPCTIARPTFDKTTNLREDNAFTYSSTQADMGCPVTMHFEKINPKRFGLFDYDGDVWFRFIFGGDVVINVEVFGYRPMTAYLYDNDSRKDLNTGLASELIPFQDRISQFCSQYTLAVKQNGLNVTFYNSNLVKKVDIEAMKNLGEQLYRSRQFIEFKPHENEALGGKIEQAFFTPEFKRMNSEEFLKAVLSEIELMERVLGYTAQEVGAQATHEQSSKEVDLINSNASNRTRFTEMAFFDAMQCKKVIYYDALMNYGSDEIVASIAVANDIEAKELADLGFTVEHDSTTSTAGVRGPKTLLAVEDFASARDGENRSADAKIAAAMIQIMPMIFNNPVLVQKVGAKQMLKRVNEMLNWAGIPGDWRFDPDKADTSEDVQKQGEALMKIVPQIVQQELAKFMEALKQSALDPISQKTQELEQALVQATQAIGKQSQELQKHDEAQDQALQEEAQAIGQLGQEVQVLDKKMDEVGGAVTSIVQHEAEAAQAEQQAVTAPAPLDPTTAAVMAAAQAPGAQ